VRLQPKKVDCIIAEEAALLRLGDGPLESCRPADDDHTAAHGRPELPAVHGEAFLT
jgi:hypothetical protein